MKTTFVILALTIISFYSCNRKEEKKEPVMVKLYFVDDKYKAVEIDTNLINAMEPMEIKIID